jgi:hypothetical protein
MSDSLVSALVNEASGASRDPRAQRNGPTARRVANDDHVVPDPSGPVVESGVPAPIGVQEPTGTGVNLFGPLPPSILEVCTLPCTWSSGPLVPSDRPLVENQRRHTPASQAPHIRVYRNIHCLNYSHLKLPHWIGAVKIL